MTKPASQLRWAKTGLVKAAGQKGGSWRRYSCSRLDNSLRGLKLFYRSVMLRGRPGGKQLARRPHRHAMTGRMVLGDLRPRRGFADNFDRGIEIRGRGFRRTNVMLISCLLGGRFGSAVS